MYPCKIYTTKKRTKQLGAPGKPLPPYDLASRERERPIVCFCQKWIQRARRKERNAQSPSTETTTRRLKTEPNRTLRRGPELICWAKSSGSSSRPRVGSRYRSRKGVFEGRIERRPARGPGDTTPGPGAGGRAIGSRRQLLAGRWDLRVAQSDLAFSMSDSRWSRSRAAR